jgi:hypothetical protein
LEQDDGLGVYAVNKGRVGTVIAAGAIRTELEHSEGHSIHFEKIILVRQTNGVHIRMNVSVAVRRGPPGPMRDIHEWHTQFFQGGLPSLGKRRP